HARSFCADWSLGHLDNDFAARGINTRDVFLGDLRPVAAFHFALDDFDAAVKTAWDDVPVMEESVFLKPDIHKSGFQTVFEVPDFAFDNAADQTFFGGAPDGELFEAAFFEHRHAGLEGLRIDDDLLVESLDGLNQPLDFLDQVARRAADGIHDPSGRFLYG